MNYNPSFIAASAAGGGGGGGVQPPPPPSSVGNVSQSQPLSSTHAHNHHHSPPPQPPPPNNPNQIKHNITPPGYPQSSEYQQQQPMSYTSSTQSGYPNQHPQSYPTPPPPPSVTSQSSHYGVPPQIHPPQVNYHLPNPNVPQHTSSVPPQAPGYLQMNNPIQSRSYTASPAQGVMPPQPNHPGLPANSSNFSNPAPFNQPPNTSPNDQHAHQSNRRRLYPEKAGYSQSTSPTQINQINTAPGQPAYVQQQQHPSATPAHPNQQYQPVSAQPSQASMASFETQIPQPNIPMPLYPKANYGSTASMLASTDNLAQSFSHLGVNQPIMQPAPLQSVSLLGMPPCPHEIHNPPPAIRLSQQAACTMSPYSNCSPTFKRCTMNVIPQTAALLAKSRVPLALYVAPFRDPEAGEPAIPVINSSVIVRCRRCRTYINPYVQFLDRGQRWKCNMCYFPNDVPDAFDFDAATQTYTDRWQKPELNHAVVEYIAPAEYMLRPPPPPVFLFVIDVSYAAVQSGMLHIVSNVIKESLDALPNGDNRTQVGFITVNSTLHFYALSATQPEPRMLVVSDLESVFLPQPEDLLVNLSECKDVISSLLDRLPSLHQTSTDSNNTLGLALLAGYEMISQYGGKIVVCQSTLPNINKGALTPKEDKLNKLDPALLHPASPFYKEFAVDCSRNHISIDMFLFPQSGPPMNLATLALAPRFTGGNVYLYSGFHASRDADVKKLSNELAHVLGRPLALETVLRVRASKGLRMAAYHGNFFVRSTDLLALPNVNPDNTYAVELAIDETIQSSVACFQTALLHTTAFGERRIRVLTMALPVTTDMKDIMHSIDSGALINILSRKAIERVLESKFEDARDAIINKIVDIIGTYKSVLGTNAHAAAAQLMVPDNLKMFAILSLGLSKHPALRCQPGIPIDLRAYYMEYLRVTSVEGTLLASHPTFYPLHRLLTETTDVGTVIEGNVVMPPYPLPATSERLERNGMYLLYDGIALYLWLSRACDPSLIQCVFGVQDYDAVQSGAMVMPSTGHPFNDRVANLVAKLRHRATQISSLYPTLFLVKEDVDPGLRMWTLGLLIEDRHEYGVSYPQLLNTLRDKVSAFAS